MALEDRLEDWRQAGLIDGPTAERILAHEAEKARPVWLWALAGLGCLALALGIVALVAANWQDIPKWVKLGVHMALTLGAAGTAWTATRRGALWTSEIALFLFAALILAGLALQAQVYQLTGELWRLLMVWLGLSAPALLIAGRSRLTAYALSGMTIWALASAAFAMDGSTVWELLLQGIAFGAPWALFGVGAVSQRAFAKGLREAGLTVLLPLVSLLHLTWAGEIQGADAAKNLVRLLPVAAMAGGAAWAARRYHHIPRNLVLPMLIGPLIATALATVIPHDDDLLPRLIGALIFGAMWIWIAASASAAGWRGLFGIAIAALAVRLFIVYFELFGSLATTGLGLIFAGLILIALAFGGRRLFRRIEA